MGCAAALFAAAAPRSTGPSLVELLAGIPLAATAMWVTFASALAGRTRAVTPGLAAATSAVLAVVVLLSTTGSALPHDPGQGRDAGRVGLAVKVAGREAAVRGQAAERPCRSTHDITLAARRAGRTVRVAAEREGCTFAGRLRLPDEGRWFVYAEFDRQREPVEAWLPVRACDRPTRVSDAARYAYVSRDSSGSAAQLWGGMLLYALMAALLVGVFATLRRNM